MASFSVSRAQINILIGFVVVAWFVSPIAYYSNIWGSKALPIVSSRVFTADGYFYNVSAVLTPELRLNETAYKNYGMKIDSDFVHRKQTSFSVFLR